jgi:hypothetical protein
MAAGARAVAEAELRQSRFVRAFLLRRLGAILLFFFAFDALIFRTGLYPSIVEPESTTGALELVLRNEIERPTPNRNQVLGIGHSRMALQPRLANQSGTGYTFASIWMGGTTPRDWYYELRAVDPTARRYAAILIAIDDFDEPDDYDYFGEREADLHYLAVRLGLRDLLPFSLSYDSPRLRWEAFSGILLKSFIFRRDFQAFLAAPAARIEKVKLFRRGSARWRYDSDGDELSLAGLSVDWKTRQIHFPDRLKPEQRQFIQDVFFKPYPPQTGRMTAFCRQWYGRILDHYRGSGTRLIFFRVPRAPVLAPPAFPAKPHSAVRDLAGEPGVIVLPEHRFDVLERPEFFADPLHLDRTAMHEFTRMLAADVQRILGPPK